MITRTQNMLKLFQRDERGQAMVMTAILSLVLFKSVMASYNVGVGISARIRAQTVADAAAYSGAVWQARFLNYCAYSRRAVLANYAHIALMNANIVNKMALDNIQDANDLWITAYQDRGNVTDMLEILETLRDSLVPVKGDHGEPESGKGIPNLVDGQHVAEHMNVLIAESQEALHNAIFPIESVMDKVIEDSCINPGEMRQAGLDAALGGGVLPTVPGNLPLNYTTPFNANVLKGALGAPRLAGINLWGFLPKGLVERAPTDYHRPKKKEITDLFESGHTKVGLPWHWGGFLIQGRPFFSIGIPPLNNPDYLKIVNVNTMPIPSLLGGDGDTKLTITNDKPKWKTGEHGWYGFPGMLGQYLWFYLKIDTPFGPIIIWIATPILGNGESWEYEGKHKIVHLYEVREQMYRSSDFHLLEPRVYSAVSVESDQVPYFRPNPNFPDRTLGLGAEFRDMTALASAKVYFQPFGANELTKRGAKPDLHYPFFGAKLATIKTGGARNPNDLMAPGRLLLIAASNPLKFLLGAPEANGFRLLGWGPNH
jgi:hypothetical protein